MPVFLFTDIEDSTKKWEAYSGVMPKVLKKHDEILNAAIVRNNGRVIKHTGDGVFAVFKSKDAFKAAVEIQRDMGNEKWDVIGELRVRIGIHAGEAELRGDDYFGPEINKTARVLSLGWGGQILATPESIDGSMLPENSKLDDLGFFTLKGVEAPQKVFNLSNPSIRWQKFPPLKSSVQQFFNMPVYNGLFAGRQDELSKISGFFKGGGAKCLTIVAQGGMGKSRLAVEAVKSLAETYLDGIVYVELAPVDNPDKIPFAVADALNYTFYAADPPVKQLISFFKERKMLLVLDNYEHLLEGADFTAQIVSACPRTSVLVTSRARLGIEGETVLDLKGLSSAQDGPALKLFWEQASKYTGGREFDEEEKKAAVDFCTKVEGLPLAMELAAPWLKVMNVSELVKEMEAGADILKNSKAGARHSSMRSLFEYSYSLLNDMERRIIGRLSVFTGGFGRIAAVKITGASLSELMSLADKSFIKVSAPSRFTMHELIRQYAAEKIEAQQADLAAIKHAHSGYFIGFMKGLHGQLLGPKQKENMELVGQDQGNITMAWYYALQEKNFETLMDIAEPVFNYFELRNRFVEGIDLFMSAIKYMEANNTGVNPSGDYMIASLLRSYAGALYRHIGSFENSEKQLLLGIAGLKKSGRMKDAAHALNHLGLLYDGIDLDDKSIAACTESYEIYTQLGDTDSAAFSGMVLASAYYAVKDYDKAMVYVSESMKVYDKTQNLSGFAWANYTMAQIELEQGRYDEARNHFEAGIRIYKHVSDKKGISWGYNMFCELEMKFKNYDEAQRLCLAGLKLRQEIGDLLGQLYSYTNLGIIAFETGRYLDAIDSLSIAFRLAVKAKAEHKASENMARAAEIFYRLGRYKQAVKCAVCVFAFGNVTDETKKLADEVMLKCSKEISAEEMTDISREFSAVTHENMPGLFDGI